MNLYSPLRRAASGATALLARWPGWTWLLACSAWPAPGLRSSCAWSERPAGAHPGPFKWIPTKSAIVGLGLGLYLAQASAQPVPDDSLYPQARPAGQAEASVPRIEQQRAALKSSLQQQERACRQGFWVHACLNEAQARYRQALKPLQQEQRLLDQAQRQQLSEQAQQRVQAKQRAQQERAAQAATNSGDGADSVSAQQARLARAQARQLRAQEQAQERADRQRQREAAAEQGRADRPPSSAPEARPLDPPAR